MIFHITEIKDQIYLCWKLNKHVPKGSIGPTLLYFVNHLYVYSLFSSFPYRYNKRIFMANCQSDRKSDRSLTPEVLEHPWVWWEKSATNYISFSLTAWKAKQVQRPDNNSSVLPDICYVLLNVILNCWFILMVAMVAWGRTKLFYYNMPSTFHSTLLNCVKTEEVKSSDFILVTAVNCSS